MSLFVLAALCGLGFSAAESRAASIQYTFQFVHGTFDNGDLLGLAGSSATLVFVLDAATLTPTSDAAHSGGRATTWPATNATITLTLSGTPSSDGTYAGSVMAGTLFQFEDDTSSPYPKDAVQFPRVRFLISGERVDYMGLLVRFIASFNTPPPPGTVFPFAFDVGDYIAVGDPTIIYLDGAGIAYSSAKPAGEVTARGVFVPEPSTALLLATALIGLATNGNRRRHGPPTAATRE